MRSSSGDINIPIIFLGIFGHMNTPILVASGTGKNRIELSSLETAAKVAAIVGYNGSSGNDYLSGFLRKTTKIWSTLHRQW